MLGSSLSRTSGVEPSWGSVTGKAGLRWASWARALAAREGCESSTEPWSLGRPRGGQ